jgi:hypothetical protein
MLKGPRRFQAYGSQLDSACTAPHLDALLHLLHDALVRHAELLRHLPARLARDPLGQNLERLLLPRGVALQVCI